ncbi:MAG: thioredoxin family protein [Ignavibacterium sp.]|jgi:thioredoxin-related protein|nr:thioredoxin family protein [Ignavibacterium sp.]
MNWLANFEQAKEEAAKSKKLILLQFEMENCSGCKKLYKSTYPDPKVEKEINEWFIPLKLDIIKDREVRRAFGAYWTPAIYFVDSNGNSFYHFNGFLPPEDFRIILRLGLTETIMPRGRYDDIINIVDQDIDDFKNSSSLPKLLIQRELARYIKTKDNSILKQTLKDIEKDYPETLEAKMNYWDE